MKIESCNQEISTNTKTLYGQSKYTGVYALASLTRIKAYIIEKQQ